jgi:hypothetical protein
MPRLVPAASPAATVDRNAELDADEDDDSNESLLRHRVAVAGTKYPSLLQGSVSRTKRDMRNKEMVGNFQNFRL